MRARARKARTNPAFIFVSLLGILGCAIGCARLHKHRASSEASKVSDGVAQTAGVDAEAASNLTTIKQLVERYRKGHPMLPSGVTRLTTDAVNSVHGCRVQNPFGFAVPDCRALKYSYSIETLPTGSFIVSATQVERKKDGATGSAWVMAANGKTCRAKAGVRADSGPSAKGCSG